MSIIHTLKKIVDPIRARAVEEELKKQREVRQEQEAGEPPLYRCRVCGHEATQGTYCPRCLSDTMQPVNRTEAAAVPKGQDEHEGHAS